MWIGGVVRFWGTLASKSLEKQDLGINTEFYDNIEPSLSLSFFVFNKLKATLNHILRKNLENRKQKGEQTNIMQMTNSGSLVIHQSKKGGNIIVLENYSMT